jgi:hypothetical protein
LEYKKAFLGAITKTSSEINTTIPGQQGFRPIETTDEKKKYQEYLWLLKG